MNTFGCALTQSCSAQGAGRSRRSGFGPFLRGVLKAPSLGSCLECRHQEGIASHTTMDRYRFAPLHLCSWNVCGLDRSILSVPAKDHCGRAGRQSHQEQVPHVTHEMSAQAVAKSIFNTEIDIEELHQPRPVASAPSARARFCKSCLTAAISNGFFGQCCGQTAVAARAQLNCGFRCTGLFGAGVLALRNGIGVVQRGGAEVGNGAIRA